MSEEHTDSQAPLGFTLRREFVDHVLTRDLFIKTLAWSPNGQMLAVVYQGYSIDIFNSQTGHLLHALKTRPNIKGPWKIGWNAGINSISWSPIEQKLAISSDEDFEIWDITTGHALFIHEQARKNISWSPNGRFIAFAKESAIGLFEVHTGNVLRTLSTRSTSDITHIAWSPTNPRVIASRLSNHSIQVWDTDAGTELYKLGQPFKSKGPGETILPSNAVWSPNGRVLAWGEGTTVQLWDAETNRINSLEGHTANIKYLIFSPDGSFLATQDFNGVVHFWYGRTQETVVVLKDIYAALAFSSQVLALADVDKSKKVRIWDLDLKTILGAAPVAKTVHYSNAKVVLLGDSGAGKSGLALALTGQPFVPTESTHGRNVWMLDNQDTRVDGRIMTRETLLWDLAGQPGYRLIHQLHLNEVAVALVVFDARSETDPFANVYHWHRALKQVEHMQGNNAPLVKKLLVAARMDRGGIGVSHVRIQALLKELYFDGYFETSAKEGWGITGLRQAIQTVITWEKQPLVSSTQLFQQIKDFLLKEKEARHLQATEEDLYHAFLRLRGASEQAMDLRAQFATCIRLVESRDLIRRLSFGNLVLLQPELLDSYASALISAVKEEPDEQGNIVEEKVLKGQFSMPQDERIKDKEQEKVLLIAMVEDLLRHEIALREQANDGPHLIFPSQSTRENPDLPDPEGKVAIFDFEGPVMNVYTTLAVRLSHSGMFKKKELWKNAVIYSAKAGGTCGIFLNNVGEGRGKLTLFSQDASEETCYHFDAYVADHLQRRALPETIKRRRIFACSGCGFIVTEQAIELRKNRGFDWLNCPVCDTSILLRDKEERLATTPLSQVQELNRAADKQRDREMAQSTLQGKIKTGDFDVFLCHNESDKAIVKRIGEQLKEQGILPWLAEWEIPPGQPWQRLLEEQIGQIKSTAVFVGNDGLEPWRQLELDAFLREFVKRKCPIIPVLLPNVPHQPQLPIFLSGMRWIDFREKEPEPLQLLIWGITGVER